MLIYRIFISEEVRFDSAFYLICSKTLLCLPMIKSQNSPEVLDVVPTVEWAILLCRAGVCVYVVVVCPVVITMAAVVDVAATVAVVVPHRVRFMVRPVLCETRKEQNTVTAVVMAEDKSRLAILVSVIQTYDSYHDLFCHSNGNPEMEFCHCQTNCTVQLLY